MTLWAGQGIDLFVSVPAAPVLGFRWVCVDQHCHRGENAGSQVGGTSAATINVGRSVARLRCGPAEQAPPARPPLASRPSA